MTWHRHPGVRSGDQLTLGERAADRVRNGMGSWPFVFTFFGAMAFWAALNSWALATGHAFDPYPYILLNLVLSTLAGVQGAILLIAAKRADQISSEVALHTERNTEELKALVAQNTELLAQNTELTRSVHQLVRRLDG